VSEPQENRIRSLARRHGYCVRKSRKACSIDNVGDFMLVDAQSNHIVFGERFDATLDQIEGYLADGGVS
jgi:hypothetical protein